DAPRQPRRDDEPCPCRDRLVDLFRTHHCARADEQRRNLGQSPERVGRGGGAKGHLGDGQAAGYERCSERRRVGRALEHDDRHDTVRAESVERGGHGATIPARGVARLPLSQRYYRCMAATRPPEVAPEDALAVADVLLTTMASIRRGA